jgi:hypothetical protein
MRRIILLVACIVAIAGLSARGQDKKDDPSSDGPAVGQAAPDFGLPWATAEAYHFNKNDWLKLSEQRGHNVILAFYAADWSPG